MQGKTIVVTGAGGVVGAAVASAASDRGATVAMIDHASFAANLGAVGRQHIRADGIDLTDLSAAERVMGEVMDKTGRIDALLNIAGGFRWQMVETGSPDTWDWCFAVNLKTALNAIKAALPHLNQSASGAIVNVGALGAVKAAAGMGAYAASKAGVSKLTESLAEELRGKTRVNAVLPSIIDTPTNRKDMPNADFSAWVQPDALAKVILFLASDEASAVTGALVPVDGGRIGGPD